MSSTHITILSINTWKCDGDYDRRMALLSQQLQLHRPHIVLCQECFQTLDRTHDTARFLSQALGFQEIFTPARFKPRHFKGTWVESFSGLALLSAYPATLVNNIELPAVPEDIDRKAQLVSIAVANQRLLVANVHLTHLPQASTLRLAQLTCVLDAMKKIPDHTHRLIAGDFNAEENSPELQRLSQEATDCYRAGQGPDRKETVGNNFQIRKSIDHIFVLNDSGQEQRSLVNSRLLLRDPDPVTGVYASDHPAIATTLVLHT